LLLYFLQEPTLPVNFGHFGPLGIIVLLLLCVVFVGLFSSSEAALISVNKLKIHTLAQKGHKGAQAVERLVEHHDKLFGTILTTENLFVILSSTLAGAVAVRYLGDYGTGVAAIVMTTVIVIFGEIVPKTLAAIHAERFALLVARPIEWVMRVTSPVVWLFTGVARALLRLTGSPSSHPVTKLSEEEIRMAVQEGALHRDEKELIHSVFEFGDTVVREVMVPRVDMACIEAKASLSDALELVNKTRHSRIPVYGENIDDIVGILHAKDLLQRVRAFDSDVKVADVMRQKRVFAPQGQRVQELLTKLQSERSSLAIVIDEYGGTAGLVTIEQLLEEIVGDIEDEFDHAENAVPQEGSVRVLEARTPVYEVNELMGIELPESETEYTSLGGFITHQMGKIPREGEELEYEGVRFIVSKTHNYKLRTITVVLPDPSPQPRPQAGSEAA
jgi:CBS domain containing-hemolysin-like protein